MPDGSCVRIARIYDPCQAADGYRVLVDRLWPRGVRRVAARIDHWARELAPSTPLRRWFGHEQGKFEEFRRRYLEELRTNESAEAGPRLAAAPGVSDPKLFGKQVHFGLPRDQDVQETLQAVGLLAENARVRRIEPGIEDVFVRLSSKQGQAEAVAADPGNQPVVAQFTGAEPANEGLRQDEETPRPKRQWFRGTAAVAIKELAQIKRQPTTLFFMIFLPILQTLLFGYAIQLNIRHIPLAILDLAQTSSSRDLSRAFENSGRFVLTAFPPNHSGIESVLRSGEVRAALVIPNDFSSGQDSDAAQLLVDGSDFQVGQPP